MALLRLPDEKHLPFFLMKQWKDLSYKNPLMRYYGAIKMAFILFAARLKYSEMLGIAPVNKNKELFTVYTVRMLYSDNAFISECGQ